MKFYHIEPHNPGPGGKLRGESFGSIQVGEHVVQDVLPGAYEIDVYYYAKRWPDIMHSLDCMLLTERVVKAFQEAGLSGVDFYPQKLRKVDSKALQKLPDPHYHWAQALTGVPARPYQRDRTQKLGEVFHPAEIDVSRATPESIDATTGFYDLSKGGMRLWKFDFSQWQGADLFYISTVRSGHRYCTQRFKDFVETHKFTNFRFTSALNPEGDWFFA